MQVRVVRKDDAGNEEWSFGHSMSDYRNGLYQVMQDIYTALYEWKYDCFFALENGIDWATRLGYTKQKDLLDNDIQEKIQSREGVLSVTDFQSVMAGRSYSCSCNVYTQYSDEVEKVEFSI